MNDRTVRAGSRESGGMEDVMTTVDAGFAAARRPALRRQRAGAARVRARHRAGDLYTADWRGGVAHLRPDGAQPLIAGPLPDGRPLQPNGIALRRDGSFLLAHLGETAGGVFRLRRDGQVTPCRCSASTASTCRRPTSSSRTPRALLGHGQHPAHAARAGLPARRRRRLRRASSTQRGAPIVADGLGYTNEVAVHPTGRWLYVNETFARRLSRFALRDDGSLGAKEVVTDSAPAPSPTAWPSTRKGTPGSSASSATA